MSQPKQTTCTSGAEASSNKPGKSENSSAVPAKATPTAGGGSAGAATGQASLGAVKGKQEDPKPQFTTKENLKSPSAPPPKTESSKGEPVKPVTDDKADDKASKKADSKGEPKEIKSKDVSKNVPVSSNKDTPAKPVLPTTTAASAGATVTGQKTKQKTETSKDSKKEESKKPAAPLAPPADKKTKGTEHSPQPPVEKKTRKVEDDPMSPDALSALGDLLPAAKPVPEPPKVQPKDLVKEDKAKAEKAVRVGEREDTIPPEYRFTEDKVKDLPPPKKEPSMDSGEALDFLSGDFSSPAAAAAPTVPAATCKKSNIQDDAADALAADFVAPQKASSVQAPVIPSSQTQQQDDPMSPDALSALGDLLPAAKPVPEPPKVQPKDLVKEDKAKAEKEVRVGEREDTIPPEYRFTEDKVKDLPPPKKEPSMDSGEALDFLSGDFSSPAAAAAPTVPAATCKKPSPDAVDALAGDFVVPQKTSSVQAPVIPSSQTPHQDDPMSPDALSALGDLLPAAKPVPEPPKVQPKDLVKEDKAKAEKAVRVGEREDTIPPEYRFTEDKVKDLPPPKKEPSMDSGEALDFLSGDFSSPAAAAAPTVPAATCKKSNPDAAAIDALAGDFVAPQKTCLVQASVVPPPQTQKQDDPMSPDALSALGDLLPAAKPVPEPPKVQPKDLVKEDKAKAEKAVRVGEREDTIPPEYRFTEDKVKDLPPPKKEPSMDSGEALDFLSGDISSPAAAAAPTVPAATSEQVASKKLKSQSEKKTEGSAPVTTKQTKKTDAANKTSAKKGSKS